MPQITIYPDSTIPGAYVSALVVLVNIYQFDEGYIVDINCSYMNLSTSKSYNKRLVVDVVNGWVKSGTFFNSF